MKMVSKYSFVFLIFVLHSYRVEALESLAVPAGTALVNYAFSNVASRLNGKMYDMVRGNKANSKSTSISPQKPKSSGGLMLKCVLFLGVSALIVYAFFNLRFKKKAKKAKLIPKHLITKKKIEKRKKQLLKAWQKWNKALKLPDDTLDIIKKKAQEKLNDWKEQKLKEALDLIENTQYDSNLSEEDISAIKEKKRKILKQKIEPLFDITGDITLKEAIVALKGAAEEIQKDMDVDLDSVLNVLGKLDGTSVVTAQPRTHIQSLTTLFNTLTSHPLFKKAKTFLLGYDNLVGDVIALNNLVAEYQSTFDEEWKKLTSTNTDLL